MKHKSTINIIVILLIAAFFTGVWALYNKPVKVPNWPAHVSGYSFSPFSESEDPTANTYPTEKEINKALDLISGQTDNIRTYSVKGSLADIPRLAEDYGLKVTLGVWLSNDLEENQKELDKAMILLKPTVVLFASSLAMKHYSEKK